MQRVILLGDMGEKFGEVWEMNVEYLKDIFKLIHCQRPEFRQYLLDCNENGTDFAIKRGGEYVGEEELMLSVHDEDIIITAVPAGAKSGFAKILLAIVIIIVVFFVPIPGLEQTLWTAGTQAGASTAASIALSTTLGLAASLALQGITQLLMPGPEVDRETPDNYLFDGNSEHIKEGFPVPLLYGEMLIGGAVINQSYSTDKIISSGLRASNNPRDRSGDAERGTS